MPYESYDKKRLKHEPTDSYFYVAIHITKCMMRADALNSHGYPVRTKMTDPSSHVCSTDESELREFPVSENLSQSCSTDGDKSKGITVHGTLSQSCSTDKDESKGITFNETLSQSCSTDKDELCSTEEDKS